MDQYRYNIPESPGSSNISRGNTLLEVLKNARVFEITQLESGMFDVSEKCDEWFGIQLTQAQLYELGAEIQRLAKQSAPTSHD